MSPSVPPRDQLLANEKLLTRACGDAVPIFSPAVRERAENAIRAQAAAGTPEGAPAKPDVSLPGWAGGVSPTFPDALASAFRATKDERFAQAGRDYFLYWLTREPADQGWRPPAGYDILSIPHRLGDTECLGWFGVLPALLASPLFDDALLERIIASASVQLDHLANTVHEGRNIRMTQGDALLTQGIRLSFLPQAQRWRRIGLCVLNDAFSRQFHADGASIEGTGWYHHICAEMSLRCWRISRQMPALGINACPKLVAKSFDYTLALMQPDGRFSVINDTTTSIPYARTIEEMVARRNAVHAELGLPADTPPLSIHFPLIQQAFSRSSWKSDADYITFDATHRIGWHWHPARNSVQIVVKGTRVLADPGRLALSGPEMRSYALRTSSHSTLNLNGWDQSDANVSLNTFSTAGYDVFEGNYGGGYWPHEGQEKLPGAFGQHHRVMLWAHGKYVAVIDHLLTAAGSAHKPALNLQWQFGPGKLAVDPTAGKAVFSAGPARVLMLNAMSPSGSDWTVAEGLENPSRGWVVSEGDKPVPAPALTVTWPRLDPWSTSLATVFVPFDTHAAPAVSTRVIVEPSNPANKNVAAISIDFPDGSSDEIWWVRRFEYALSDRVEFETDASLVVIHKGARSAVKKALVVNGTYFSPFTTHAKPHRETFVVEP